MSSRKFDQQGFAREYSEGGFWDKVKDYALAAGAEVIEKALQLYYCLQDSDTPRWAKAVIVGALGYFVSFVDAVPDLTPIVGYTDDLGVLAAAIATLAANIKQQHKDAAAAAMRRWFH